MRCAGAMLVLLAAGCDGRLLDGEARAWLEDHATPLDPEAPRGLSTLDDLFEGASFVLLAEHHGVEANYAVTEGFVRYLHAEGRLGAVAEESGPGLAWLASTSAGDPDALADVFAWTRSTYAGTTGAVALHASLADVTGAPDAPEWTGADIEHLWAPGILALDAQRCAEADTGPLAALADLATRLASGGVAGPEEALAVVAALDDAWEDATAHLCDPSLARRIVDALLARFDAYAAWADERTAEGDERREAFVTSQMQALSGRSEGPVIGQWGSWHVTRPPTGGLVDPFALRLRATASRAVVSVALAYTDCEGLDLESGGTRAVDDPVGDALADLALGPFTLLRLDGLGSPFDDAGWLIPEETDHVTTDLFEAVLLVRGSEAAEPLP